LRVSEAFNLRMDDITPDGLLIRMTKFRKTRLVPIHETTTVALEQYIAKRRMVSSPENSLFISLRGNRLCYRSVCGVFHSCLRAAGIQRQTSVPRPRLHSFRHTLIVRALENCTFEPAPHTQHIIAQQTHP